MRLLGDPLTCHERIMREGTPAVLLRAVVPPVAAVPLPSSLVAAVEPLPLFRLTALDSTSRFLRRPQVRLEALGSFTVHGHVAKLTLRRDNGFRAVYKGTGRGFDGERIEYSLTLRTDLIEGMRARGIVAAGQVRQLTQRAWGLAFEVESDDVDVYSHLSPISLSLAVPPPSHSVE